MLAWCRSEASQAGQALDDCAGCLVELSNAGKEAAALGRVPASAGNVVADVVQQLESAFMDGGVGTVPVSMGNVVQQCACIDGGAGRVPQSAVSALGGGGLGCGGEGRLWWRWKHGAPHHEHCVGIACST
eukprot:1158157-Pelagomonas_calceolata.AAC.11